MIEEAVLRLLQLVERHLDGRELLAEDFLVDVLFGDVWIRRLEQLVVTDVFAVFRSNELAIAPALTPAPSPGRR